MLDEAEAGAPKEYGGVRPGARMVVVQPDDFMAGIKETHDQVGPEKAGRPCDDVTH